MKLFIWAVVILSAFLLLVLRIPFVWVVVIAGVALFVGCWIISKGRSKREPPAPTGPPRSRPAAQGSPTTSRLRSSEWKCSPAELFEREHVSYSRLRLFDQCPRRFELVYLMGKEDPVGKPAELGSVVHKMLELFTTDACADSRLVDASVVERILNYFAPALAAVRPRYSIAKTEVVPYLWNFVKINQGPLRAIETEHQCYGSVGTRKLKCVIDRIDQDAQGGCLIVDYKTGKPQYATAQQLNVYAYALDQSYTGRLRLQYQFLKTGEIKEWVFTPALKNSIANWLSGRVTAIESVRVFPEKRGPLCQFCGLSRFCR